MNKAETVIDFIKHVNKLLAEGEKKSWIEAESELANKTLTQILEWGEGPELIPMKASTLAKLQDFNKKVAMGGLIKYPAVKAKRRGRPKKEEVEKAENIDEGYSISADSFFGLDNGNGKDQSVKIPIVDHQYVPQANNVIDKPSRTRHKLTPEEMDQIKKDLGLYVGLDDPDLTIDKAIVLLNRACKKNGVACEVVIKSA
jgi:hypothetical protein